MTDLTILRGYQALTTGAAFIERARSRWRVSGASAVETINGLVTNDVAALEPGTGCYAAVLTAKGRIVADLRVLRDGDDLLLDTGSAAAPGLRETLRKYVNPRFAKCTELTSSSATIAVMGPEAARAAARAASLDWDLAELAAWSHRSGGDVMVVRAPELAVPVFEMIVPPDGVERVTQALADAGAVTAAAEVVEIARIEAGWPIYGTDMDDTTLAQEANLEQLGAISFTKGCYIGQETVARVHFRGHVNRTLRRVRFAKDAPVERGASLNEADGRALGEVRSAAVSPATGGVGIAMVRQEVAAGSTLLAGAEPVEVQ